MKLALSRFSKYASVLFVFIVSFSFVHFSGESSLLRSSVVEAKTSQQAIVFSRNHPQIRAAIQVKNRHIEDLMATVGVEGVGIGFSHGHPVIKVFTTGAGIHGIPESLDGLPVEVKVTGRIVALLDPVDPTTRFDRPVPIGVSTGHPNITAGTIGCRVVDSYGNVYALSNNHVYADENDAAINDNVLQPGVYDGGTDPADAIGTLFDFEPIGFCRILTFGCPSNTMDAAIALTTTDTVGVATPANGYGAPTSIVVPAELNQPVQKYGRTTEWTTGTITGIDFTVTVGYSSGRYAKFDQQILVESDTAFSQGGDSGSLVVDLNRNPVGLLFAGNQTGTTTFANPIGLVAERFAVTVDDGSSAGNNPPTVTINSPAEGASFASGESISFAGSTSDTEDGDLTADLVWKSDKDGQIGTGGSFSAVLNDGPHIITAEVTDSGSLNGSSSVTITVGGGDTNITLTATGKRNRRWYIIDLDWSGATLTNVDIYRNGSLIATTSNDGAYTDKQSNDGSGGPYTYQVCEAGSSTCSNEATVTF